MPEHAEKEALKQLGRLERMHPDASEATMVRTYVDWMIEMPWSKATDDSFDLDRAKAILDEDHFDLKKINLEEHIRQQMWTPVYLPYKKISR